MVPLTSFRAPMTVLACALLLQACNGARPADRERTLAAPPRSASTVSLSARALPPAPAPYPRAAWRLTPPGSLAPLVLWFSQIVIRHAAAPAEVSFNLAYWRSVREVTRSREEALALAQRVAEQAAREPSRFSELARRYSDELPSGDEGGEMGGMSAIQMDLWPEVLDALSALRPGQTSHVVETHYGFHVFFRSGPPASETVSGSHIVIGHEQALWLEVYARGKRAQRTRAEALALANDIYRQARAEPERFAELVQHHSEHRDATADGDFGAWSTLEPNPFPPRTKRLQELEVGQVGAPIETHLGFEIIRRTAPRPRAQYRSARLVFPVRAVSTDAPRPPDPTARSAALKEAEALAQRLAQDPSGFDALGPYDVQWEEGRESPELAAALASLRPGEFTPTPVDTEDGFVVARRLEPKPVTPRAFESEFPAPQEPELRQVLASVPPTESALVIRGLAAESSLEPATATLLRELYDGHELAHMDVNTSPEARSRLLGDWFDRSRKLLGDDTYEGYRIALGRIAAARFLPAPNAHREPGL